MKENSVTARLKKVMLEKGVKNAHLAKAVGVTPQAVGAWFKKNSIGQQSIVDCANYLNISLDWLMNGERKDNVVEFDSNKVRESGAEYMGTIEPWDSTTPLNEDDVEVPFYMEVELSAGAGLEVQLETAGPKLRFSRSTLKRQGVDVANAACVRVTGNSMEPVIPDGAAVGIDTSRTTVKDGDMFAIDWAGALFVKILTRRPGGGLRIKSFNHEEYPEEILDEEEAKNIRVIGRVFWYSVLL
ncbi:LexA family transcriptional regulator [Alteromonas sp. P256]|uniref:LexA family transcriptional regulator n=1 Tax=Alteromonas sp. P256 TaxID=3117399 RepID=UPI002FE38C13